jgi:hypothetical protein
MNDFGMTGRNDLGMNVMYINKIYHPIITYTYTYIIT